MVTCGPIDRSEPEMTRPGTRRGRSVTVVTWAVVSCSPVTAVSTTGTFRIDSCRLRAVTMISPELLLAASALSCATAATGIKAAAPSSAKADVIVRKALVFIVFLPRRHLSDVAVPLQTTVFGHFQRRFADKQPNV